MFLAVLPSFYGPKSIDPEVENAILLANCYYNVLTIDKSGTFPEREFLSAQSQQAMESRFLSFKPNENLQEIYKRIKFYYLGNDKIYSKAKPEVIFIYYLVNKKMIIFCLNNGHILTSYQYEVHRFLKENHLSLPSAVLNDFAITPLQYKIYSFKYTLFQLLYSRNLWLFLCLSLLLILACIRFKKKNQKKSRYSSYWINSSINKSNLNVTYIFIKKWSFQIISLIHSIFQKIYLDVLILLLHITDLLIPDIPDFFSHYKNKYTIHFQALENLINKVLLTYLQHNLGVSYRLRVNNVIEGTPECLQNHYDGKFVTITRNYASEEDVLLNNIFCDTQLVIKTFLKLGPLKYRIKYIRFEIFYFSNLSEYECWDSAAIFEFKFEHDSQILERLDAELTPGNLRNFDLYAPRKDDLNAPFRIRWRYFDRMADEKDEEMWKHLLLSMFPSRFKKDENGKPIFEWATKKERYVKSLRELQHPFLLAVQVLKVACMKSGHSLEENRAAFLQRIKGKTIKQIIEEAKSIKPEMEKEIEQEIERMKSGQYRRKSHGNIIKI